MTDELEKQLRELGSSIGTQLDEPTVFARRESAVSSAMRARQVAAVEPRLNFRAWFAELLTPGALLPSAGVCVMLLGVVFLFQETPQTSSLMTSSVRIAEVEPEVEVEIESELASEVSLVSASLMSEFEAEFESEGGEDEVGFESLSFSEDDFDTEEDFGSEYETETI